MTSSGNIDNTKTQSSRRLRPRPAPSSSSSSSFGAPPAAQGGRSSRMLSHASAAGGSRRNNSNIATIAANTNMSGSTSRRTIGSSSPNKRSSTMSQITTTTTTTGAAASVQTHRTASQPCDYEAPLNEPVARGQPKSKMRRSRAGKKFRKRLLSSSQGGSGGSAGASGRSGYEGSRSGSGTTTSSAMKRSASDGSVYLLGRRSDQRRRAGGAPTATTRAQSEGDTGYHSSYSDDQEDTDEYESAIDDDDDDDDDDARSMVDSASRDLDSDEIDEYANPQRTPWAATTTTTTATAKNPTSLAALDAMRPPPPSSTESNLSLLPTAAVPSAKELLRRSNEVQDEVELRKMQDALLLREEDTCTTGDMRRTMMMGEKEQKVAAARLERDLTAPIDLSDDQHDDDDNQDQQQQQQQHHDARPSELTHATDNRTSSLVDQFDVDDVTSVVTTATPYASNVEIRKLYEEGKITKAEYTQMVQADERFEMANFLGVDAADAAAAAKPGSAAVPSPAAPAPRRAHNPYLPVSRVPSDESSSPPDHTATRTEDTTSDEAVVHQYSSESTMQTPDSEDLSHAVHQVEARPRTTTPIKPRRGSMSDTSSHREEANAARLAAARRHAMRRLSSTGGPTPQRTNRQQQEQDQAATADANASTNAGNDDFRPGMARRRSSLEVGDEVPNPYGRPLPREHLFSARHIQGRRASAGSSTTDASGDISSMTPTSEPRRKTWSGADEGAAPGETGRKLPGGIANAALQHGLGTAERKGKGGSTTPNDPAAAPASKFKNPWAPMAKGGSLFKGKGAMGKKGAGGASDLIERNTISTAPSSSNARPSGGAWEVTQVEEGGDMTAEEIEELQAFSQAAKSWSKKKGKAKKGKKTSSAVAAILGDVQEAQMDEEDEEGMTLPQGPDASASLVISRPPAKSKKPKRSLKAEADAAADQRLKRLEKASRAAFAAERRQQEAEEAKHYTWDERKNTKSSAKEIAQRSKATATAAKPSAKQNDDNSLDTEEMAMTRRVQQLEAETGATMSRWANVGDATSSSGYPSSSIDHCRASEATVNTGPSSSVQPSTSDHYRTSEGSLLTGHSSHRPSSTSAYTNTSTSYQTSSKASRLERIESGIEFEEDSREGVAADGNLYPIGEDSTQASSYISKKQQKKLQRVMNNAAKRHMSHLSTISNDVSVMTDSGNGLTVATEPSLINAESEALKSNDLCSEGPPVNDTEVAEPNPLTTFTKPLKSPDTDVAVAQRKSEKAMERKSSRLSEASTEYRPRSANNSDVSGLTAPSVTASAGTGLFPVESLKDVYKPNVVLPKKDGSNSSPDYEKIAVEENIWRHINELLDDCLSIMDGPGEESSSASGTYVSEGGDTETVTSRMTRKSHDWDLLSQIGAGETDSFVRKRGRRVQIDEVEEVSKAKAALASFNDYFHDSTESFRSGATEAFEKTWAVASRASSVASFGEDYSLAQIEGNTSVDEVSETKNYARPKTNVAVSRSILRGSLKELSRRNLAIASNNPNTDSESVGATREPMQKKDTTRIMPETKEEMWVRRGLENMEDAKLGKIAIDTFSNLLVESMPIGIQAAIMDHADETGIVLKDAAEIDLNQIDVAPEKKALLAGPHLTLYEVFRWSLQVNVDHLVKAEGAEERRKRKEVEKERAKHAEENEQFEEAFEQFLGEALAKETERAAEAAMASPERNYLPDILHPIQEEDSRPLGSEQSRISTESNSEDTDTSSSVLSAALKLGAVAAEEDNMKEEDVSNDPLQYLSTISDDENGNDPFECVLRNRRRSSILSTLEEVEEKSSSEMSDDAKLNQLLGLNEIQSQDEGESQESQIPRRESLTPAALERAAGIRSISKSSDLQRSSSGTTQSSLARPSSLLQGGIANAAARHGLIRSNGMSSLHANSSSSQGMSRTSSGMTRDSSGMTRASSGMTRTSSLTASTSGPGILRSRYSSRSSSMGTPLQQERRASDPVSTSTSRQESSVTIESSDNEGRSVRFAMPRGQNINRSEIDRMREEFGLVRDIETKKKSDPFEKAISDYNQSFSRPSQISESATRLIKELQEMRRKKEETDSAQKLLAVSSKFQPKIIDEGQQRNGVLADYSTRSKSSLAHDEDFAETLSIFAESAKLTYFSNSSSSKTPGSSSAGTNGSGGQATMHLFTENDSSAYASSSATGTTNAHTLSESDTFFTKESSKDPSAYAGTHSNRVQSPKSLCSSISSGLDHVNPELLTTSGSETYTKESSKDSNGKDPSRYSSPQTPAISSTTLVSSISSGFDHAPEPSTLLEMTK